MRIPGWDAGLGGVMHENYWFCRFCFHVEKPASRCKFNGIARVQCPLACME